jgi:hypothetical protein
MKKWIILAVVLSLALTGPVLAQMPKVGQIQAPTASKHKPFTITGKITKAPYAYIIRVQMPPERFAVMNPNPKVLDRLVKSGKTVTVEVVSIMGDNVKIQKIDGKPYKGATNGEKAKTK